MSSGKRTGIIYFAQGILEQWEYAKVIESKMPPRVWEWFPDSDDAFTRDGTPCYKAPSTSRSFGCCRGLTSIGNAQKIVKPCAWKGHEITDIPDIGKKSLMCDNRIPL